MSHLDNVAVIRQIDPHNYLDHILDVPEQLTDGFTLGDNTILPASYSQAKNLIILTSGEMAPLAYSLQALMVSYARIPVSVSLDFVLPKWVSTDTLVLALDYYGDNEQVLVAFREAAKRKSRLLSVSVAGVLSSESRRYRSPHIALNYGAPARIAFFYTFACLAQIFKKLDFVEIKESMIMEAAVLSRSLLQNINPEVPQFKNNAKQLAEKILTHRSVIVSPETLFGVAKKWQTNFAATGKILSVSSVLSEFNDTIINSLGFQSKGSDAPVIVMLQSKYDNVRNKLHQTLVYQVAQARKLLYEPVFMHPSGSQFGEIVLSALMGEMVSYYLAMLQNQDPSFVEATGYIKEQLQTQPLP